jgi:MFS family permease
MPGFGGTGYRALFALPAYRRFWLGFSGSVLGDAIGRVALTWYVYEATGSARALGWLMLCYTAPILVGGLVAGSLLDRFDRRTVMLADNAIRGAAMALIPLLHALDLLALWHVYAAAAVYGGLMMISLAGGPSLVPSLVPAERLATANALEMLSFTLGGVIGPPLAGLLLARIAAPTVVLLDALSYALFALALASIRVDEAPAATLTEGGGQRSGLGDAVRLLFRSPVLRATTFMFMAYNVGNGILAVWLPLLTDRKLDGGAGLYGGLLGLMALGEVAGALLSGSLVLPLALGAAICLAQTLAGASLLLLLVPTVWAAGTGVLLFGLFSAPLTVWAQTLRMGIIPERLRGRAFALLRTIMQGGNPIGGALGGLLVPVFGIPAMIAFSVLLVGGPGLLGARVADLRGAGAPGRTPDAPDVDRPGAIPVREESLRAD